MPKKLFIKSLAISMLALALCVSAFAQKGKDKSQTDPNDKARNYKKEVNRVYKDWLNKDVPYIITSDETKAFKALATDEEREAFIENFWRRRDPNPDTEENEYREQYYERIAYANEHYASGIPGWKTDRGRTYIRFGKPDGVESHPSGGQYDRPSYEGGGSTTTYPFETWFYRHLDNVGEGIEIEFVDPTGTGEYRIARNANEKDALLYTGGGQTLNEQLGLESRSDRISGINNGNVNFQREQDSPFRRLEILTSIERAPSVKFADLESSLGGTDTPLLDDALNFDVRVDFFRQTDDKIITAFTIQADNSDLAFKDDNGGGFQTAKLNIFGRIQAVSGKRVGIFEDSVTTDSTVEELADAKSRKSAYQKSYPLAPGTYKVDVVVRDVATGKKGVKNIGFTVPKYNAEKLSTSTLVLASKLANLTDREIGGQFTIGDKKVIPNVSGIYRKGQEIGVYLQIYNAGIDQTTLRPSVDVNYILLKGGKEVGRQPESWSGLSDAGQRLTLARLISTQSLTTGDYELKISIKDRVGNETLEPSAKFSIKE